MRIGLLFEYGSLNGGEHSMLAALGELYPRHIDVVAFAPEIGPLSKQLRDRGIPVIPFDLKQRSPQEQLQVLTQTVTEFDLNLLHANSLAMGRKLGQLAKHLQVPTSTHIRDIIKLNRSSVADLNQHRRLFAVSNATRAFHIAQGFEPQRILTLYNGVDTHVFRPRPKTGSLKDELGLPDNALLAATIGQICLRKGQRDLAQAAIILKGSYPNLHYLLIGERHSQKAESIEFDNQITTCFSTAGMTSQLHRLGYREDIHLLLNEIDVLVHPARQEPLGRVLLEAASSGTPIVATAVGGTEEILVQNRSAILVPPRNPDALASGIDQLLHEPLHGKLLGKNARSHIERHFSLPRAAQTLLDAWLFASNESD